MSASVDRRVLMIAYHFPPFRGSSGMERTLSFCRNLPSSGWQPLVLTVHPRAFPDVGSDRLGEVSADIPVARAFALDAQRHLSLAGKYPRWAALPDRWLTWVLGAVPAGLGLVRRFHPQVIWSTYPIATAHIIGYLLHRLTGLPWVADFRDPMVETDAKTGAPYPTDAALRESRLRVERRAARYASRIVFCTEGARRICAERYPDTPVRHWAVIPNGYDEGNFTRAEGAARRTEPTQRIVLLHSGLLYYGTDRDPTAFLDAIRKLQGEGAIGPATLKVVFRGSGHDDIYRRLIDERGLGDIVFLEPLVPYAAALAEMASVDGLLVFQGYTSNPAIPAKLYEYLRAQRPILAMADAAGDTAALLNAERAGTVVPLDQPDRIAEGLEGFLAAIRDGRAAVLARERVSAFSREARTRDLAALLDDLTR